MSNLEIQTSTNTVHFTVPELDYHAYEIPIKTLGATCHKSISQWVSHLLAKPRVQKETLYALATAIQKFNPNNSIDWKETFYEVEAKYLHSEENAMQVTSGSAVANVMNEIKWNYERADTPEYHKELERRVETSMTLHGFK